MVGQVVKCIFFGKEVFQLRRACHCNFMEETDISASAKVAKGPVFIAAPHGDGVDRRIVFPAEQGARYATHHAQAQCIHSLGT